MPNSFLRCLPLVLLAPLLAHAMPDQELGAEIYRQQCLECHGAKGEGVEGKADDALVGDRSLESLTRRIERTMPEDNAEACVGPDAAAVAAYIYDAFYSPEAQGVTEPPPLDLSRLTVEQHRTSLSDVLERFRQWGVRGFSDQRGLKARYSGRPEYKPVDEKGKKVNPPKDVWIEREDPWIKFDFKDRSPVPEKFASEKFQVRWTGSLLVEESGEYEFVLRTQNGARFWINDLRGGSDPRQLIDGWVSDGPEVRDESGKIFLLGGRPYPIQLEFFSYKEKTASIEWLWRKPGGVLETVPGRLLSPVSNQGIFLPSIPFPADDRSYGYERGTSVSQTWYDAITQSAVEAADHVIEKLDSMAKTEPEDKDRPKKIREFCRQLAETAFRRPLTEEQKAEYVDAILDGAEDQEKGVRRVVLAVFTAPEFLYPMLGQKEEDSWSVAARLALTLWDSVPSRRLHEAAQRGDLLDPKRVRQEVTVMLRDPRAKVKMRGFFRQWLELERGADVTKDKKRFPTFTEQVMADLGTSLQHFLDEVVWGEDPDFRRLLLEDQLYLNKRLGTLYGAEVKESGFHSLPVDGGRRAGVMTHPYLLAAFSYHNNTSPIHRGVFLTRNIVGMRLKPPPEAIEFEDATFDPHLTMREKVTELTRSDACMACHSTINPLGFSLENFDAIGRWRTKEKNKPIDPKGEFITEEGTAVALAGARDLADFAATSPASHQAFVKHLFHHLVKQPAAAYGLDTIERLADDFSAKDFNIRSLMSEIAVTAALPMEKDPSVARN